jgi:hypothetical protein
MPERKINMSILEHELETIKAFSAIWRNSPECCPHLRECDCDERYMSGNDPLDFLTLTEEERAHLIDWIDGALRPDDDYICPDSSYGIKHVYERDTGKYVTNGQFKGAMIQFGFDPVDPRELNCHYCLKIESDVLERTH